MLPDIRLNYVLTAVDRGSRRVVQSDRTIRSSLEATNRVMKQTGTVASNAARVSQRAAATTTTAHRRTTTSARSVEQATRAAGRATDAAARSAQRATRETGRLSGGWARVRSAAQGAGRAVGLANRETGRSGQRGVTQLNQQARAWDRVRNSARTAGRAARDAARQTVAPGGRLPGQTPSGSTSLSAGLGGGLAARARIPVAAGAAAAGLGVLSIVKQAAGFEQQMARIRAVSSATRRDFKLLTDQALQLGAKTQFSAREAADGMYQLSTAGFKATEVMKAIPGTLDLAAASGIELGRAAEIQAAALRGFSLPASQATHVADVMAATVNRSAAEMDDLGESLKYIAPVAHATGQSFTDMMASIALMSNVGIKGSQAGTTLRGGLVRLVKPTRRVQETFKDLHLSFETLRGPKGLKPLPQIMGILSKHMEGLSKGQKNAALATIFGTESLSGMLQLMDQGPKKINRLSSELDRSDGYSRKAAKTMRDTMSGAWDNFSGSLETASIELTRGFSPAVKGALDVGADFINKVVLGLTTRKGGGQIGGVLRTLREDVVAVGEGIVAAAKPLGPLVKELAKIGGGAVLVALKILGATLKEVSSVVRDMMEVAQALAPALRPLRPLLIGVAGGLLAIVAAKKALSFVYAISGVKQLIALYGVLRTKALGAAAAETVASGAGARGAAAGGGRVLTAGSPLAGAAVGGGAGAAAGSVAAPVAAVAAAMVAATVAGGKLSDMLGNKLGIGASRSRSGLAILTNGLLGTTRVLGEVRLAAGQTRESIRDTFGATLRDATGNLAAMGRLLRDKGVKPTRELVDAMRHIPGRVRFNLLLEDRPTLQKLSTIGRHLTKLQGTKTTVDILTNAPNAQTAIAAMRATLKGVPSSYVVKILQNAPNAKTAMKLLRKAVRDIPPERKIRISTPGMNRTIKALEEVKRRIDNLRAARVTIPTVVQKPQDIRPSPGGRQGGQLTPRGFRRFQAGGMVVAQVSPGEVVEYGGATWQVPGARTAADSVTAALPVGARVFTGHGQQLMAQGYAPDEALQRQRPHFAKGGFVNPTRVGATVYGGTRGDDNGLSNYGPPLGSRRHGTHYPFAELAMGRALGGLPRHFRLLISRGARSVVASREDVGPGYADRKIDLWRSVAQALNVSTTAFKGPVTIRNAPRGVPLGPYHAGRANHAGAAAAGSTATKVTQAHLQDLLTPSVPDAFAQGFGSGQTGVRPGFTGTPAGLAGVAAPKAPSRTDATTRPGGRDRRSPGSPGFPAWVKSLRGTAQWPIPSLPASRHQVAAWIRPGLEWARSHGWRGSLTSGYRSHALNVSQGRSYYSEHEGTRYPHGAVDFGGMTGSAAYSARAAFLAAQRGYPGPHLRPLAGDAGHVSGTGHRRGGYVGLPHFRAGGLGRLPLARTRHLFSTTTGADSDLFLAALEGIAPEEGDLPGRAASRTRARRSSSAATMTLGQLRRVRRFDIKQLRRLTKLVGFAQPFVAAAVAMGESSGRANARGDGGWSKGLWQIYTRVHGWARSLKLDDPVVNARAAMRISGGGKNWKPWTVWKSGKYRQFMRSGGLVGYRTGTGKVAAGAGEQISLQPLGFSRVLGGMIESVAASGARATDKVRDTLRDFARRLDVIFDATISGRLQAREAEIRKRVAGIRRGGVTRAERGPLRALQRALRATQHELSAAQGVTYEQMERMAKNAKGQIAQLAKGGLTGTERVQVRRLRSMLALLHAEMGERIGEVSRAAQRAVEALERGRTQLTQALSIAGVDEASSAGIKATMDYLAASNQVLEAQVAPLQQAIERARRLGQTEIAQQLGEQLQGIRDSLAQNFTDWVAAWRARIETVAQESVDAAGFGSSLVQAQYQGFQLEQQLRDVNQPGYSTTPEARQSRRDFIMGQIVPQLQNELSAYEAQIAAAQQTGNVALWRQAMLDATNKRNEIAQAQLDAEEATKENTEEMANNLKEFYGSVSFDWQDQQFTDVLNAGVGA